MQGNVGDATTESCTWTRRCFAGVAVVSGGISVLVQQSAFCFHQSHSSSVRISETAVQEVERLLQLLSSKIVHPTIKVLN